MGASRLIDEALARHRRRRPRVPAGRSRSSGPTASPPGGDAPYAPFRSALDALPRRARRRRGARPPRSRRRGPPAAAAADGRAPGRGGSSTGDPRAPGRPDPRGLPGRRRQARGARGPSSSSWRISTSSTRRRGRCSRSSRGRSATGPSPSSGPTSPRRSGRAIPSGRRSRPSTRGPRPRRRIAVPPLDRAALRLLITSHEGVAPSAPVLLLVAERSGGSPLIAEEVLVARRELSGASLTVPLEQMVVARAARRTPGVPPRPAHPRRRGRAARRPPSWERSPRPTTPRWGARPRARARRPGAAATASTATSRRASPRRWRTGSWRRLAARRAGGRPRPVRRAGPLDGRAAAGRAVPRCASATSSSPPRSTPTCCPARAAACTPCWRPSWRTIRPRRAATGTGPTRRRTSCRADGRRRGRSRGDRRGRRCAGAPRAGDRARRGAGDGRGALGRRGGRPPGPGRGCRRRRGRRRPGRGLHRGRDRPARRPLRPGRRAPTSPPGSGSTASPAATATGRSRRSSGPWSCWRPSPAWPGPGSWRRSPRCACWRAPSPRRPGWPRRRSPRPRAPGPTPGPGSATRPAPWARSTAGSAGRAPRSRAWRRRWRSPASSAASTTRSGRGPTWRRSWTSTAGASRRSRSPRRASRRPTAAGLEVAHGNLLRGNAADFLVSLGRWSEAREHGAPGPRLGPVGRAPRQRGARAGVRRDRDGRRRRSRPPARAALPRARDDPRRPVRGAGLPGRGVPGALARRSRRRRAGRASRLGSHPRHGGLAARGPVRHHRPAGRRGPGAGGGPAERPRGDLARRARGRRRCSATPSAWWSGADVPGDAPVRRGAAADLATARAYLRSAARRRRPARRGRRPPISGGRSSSRTTWPGPASTRRRRILGRSAVGRRPPRRAASTPARPCSSRRRIAVELGAIPLLRALVDLADRARIELPARRPRAGGVTRPRRHPSEARAARPPRASGRRGPSAAAPSSFGLSPREQGVLAEIVAGSHQPGDRGAPLHQREDRRRPRREHPREARRGRPGRGGHGRASPRPRRRPARAHEEARTRWSGLPGPAARRRRLSVDRGEGPRPRRRAVYQRLTRRAARRRGRRARG